MDKSQLINDIKKYVEEVPFMLRRFAVRAIILWGIFTVANHFLFVPGFWLNTYLTFTTSNLTTISLNHFYHPGFVNTPLAYGFQNIYYNNERVLYITDGCNALTLYQAYLCFFLCVPGKVSRKLFFAFLGLSIIFVLNIIRCYALTWLNMNKPEWTDFAHHYAFTFIVYTCIFILCTTYLRALMTKATE